MTGRHIDCQGNFETVTTDGTPESRTHNAQNQLTQVGSSTLTFDANGNMTTDETGRQFAFDAWNRLISGDSPNIGFAYDALNRRIQEVRPSETRDLFYSTDCQLLEEQVNTVAVVHYVWSPVYVDALVLRHGADSGDPQPVLYAMQDANFNVTGIVDTGGSVQERYVYDPYGAVTVLTTTCLPLSGTQFGWNNYHQGLRFVIDVGLYYVRYRFLSPTLQRWVSPDQVWATNLYSAYRNRPVNSGDSDGTTVTFFLRPTPMPTPLLRPNPPMIGRPVPPAGPNPVPPGRNIPGPAARPIPSPTPPGPGDPPRAGENMNPPGDCSDSEYNGLRQAVLIACRKLRGAAPLPTCTGNTLFWTCDELKDAAQKHTRCANARKELNVKCFRGGDAGHHYAMLMARYHADTCWYKYNWWGCGRSCPPQLYDKFDFA